MGNKTISEFAKELGLTNQGIYYHLRKLENQKRTKDKQGRIVLTDDEQEQIKAFVTTQDNQTQDKDFNSADIGLIETLKEQLATKDEQINKLQTLLSQQQSLTLQANERIKLLENTTNDDKQDFTKDDKAEVNTIKRKRGFFERLFDL